MSNPTPTNVEGEPNLEAITILAGLIRKAKRYDTPLIGSVYAVSVQEIAEAMEKLAGVQTVPPVTKKGNSK